MLLSGVEHCDVTWINSAALVATDLPREVVSTTAGADDSDLGVVSGKCSSTVILKHQIKRNDLKKLN